MAPLAGAQVHVVGTTVGQLSDGEGRFLLVNVPAGEQVVRVQLLGYAAAEQEVSVTGGETAAVTFELGEEAIALEGVVVTALGITGGAELRLCRAGRVHGRLGRA